ncbi:ornithine decarboxylase [[Candida] anglica]|uniref:ornithine decarboxylase n=1 Tax=[Candida] anglica TaxID=148631 RepID=A0ABP0E5U6_9ASCO
MAPSVVTQEQPSVPAGDLFRYESSSHCKSVSVPASAATPNTNLKARAMIGQALNTQVSNIDLDECDPGDEDSFFVADLGEVHRAFNLWMQHLPQVQPFYAVKCNTDRKVISLLASLGCNFDCASKAEIDIVLSLGISADRIVYANPCKTNSFIRNARTNGVQLTTVDNSQELYKLAQYHPGCGILLRLATDDELAQCRLSTKFGCSVATATHELMPLAKELGLSVKGVAFHVGSGATDLTSIFKAIRDARQVFDHGLSHFGFDMSVLDIGGGFQQDSFIEASAMVRRSLDQWFPQDFAEQHDVKFIAEPGRFMVSNAFTLAAHVIARRDCDELPMLYINDGVYGNLNCILFDHQHPEASVLTHLGEFVYDQRSTSSRKDFSIWGPTCDGLDCVSSRAGLGHDVAVGDWLYFSNLGAYTSAATTSFNGFKSVANVIYVNSESD